MGKMNFTRQPAILRMKRITDVLRERGPLTPNELAPLVHCVVPTLGIYLKYMTEQGMIHIGGWTREAVAGLREFPRPQYQLGPGKNKRKPRPFTNNEVARRLYARAKDDPENYPNAYRMFQRERIVRAQRSKHERIEHLAREGFPPAMARAASSKIRAGSRRRSPTPDQVSEVVRLRDAGHTWNSVASQTGVHRTTARDYYRKLTGN